MNDQTIILSNSPIHTTFTDAVRKRRMVFFAGIPGVGKSFWLKQLALMAHAAGRRVHSLQWDVSRYAFETAENLTRFPEVDGVTHAVMRKAVGLWARQGVFNWHQQHPGPADMLIGEVPLIGNRLIELVQRREDEVESLLAAEQTLFLVPVPSREVRHVIEAAREKSIALPQHAREAADAPPNVLQAIWRDVYQLGFELGLMESEPTAEMRYDPEVYKAVFLHLLQHRNAQVLEINEILRSAGSAYDLDVVQSELRATAAEAREILAAVEEKWSAAEVEALVNQWYEM